MKPQMFFIMLSILFLITVSGVNAVPSTNLSDSGDISINGTTTTTGMLLTNAGWTFEAGTGSDWTYETGGFTGIRSLNITNTAGTDRMAKSFTPDYPRMFIWKMYDDNAVSKAAFVRITDAGTDQTDLGVRTGDDATHYIYMPCSGGAVAGSVVRSAGWHTFNITFVTEDSVLYNVDGTEIGSSVANCPAFTKIRLDSSTLGTTAAWDDILYCNNRELCSSTPPTSPITFSVNWTAPLNNTQYSTSQLNFTFDLVNATLPLNISLYKNGQLNASLINVNSLGVTSMLFNTSDASSQYNFHIYAQNNETNTTFANRTIYIDSIFPGITAPANFNLSSTYKNNVTGQFTFTDDFLLYSYKVALNGVTVDSKVDLNTATYIYNLSINKSSLSNGVNYIQINTSDGHTAKEIKPYSFNKNKDNGLTFGFNDGYVEITPEDKANIHSFETTKKFDRYEFKHVRKNIKASDSYIVKSDKPITIVQNNKYMGWLIVGELNKWIDFENDAGGEITTTRIDANTVRITANNLNKKDVNFHSIGDLNTVSKTYSIYSGNVNTTWYNVTETQTTQFTALFDYNVSFITDINATFFWNGTEYAYDSKSIGGLFYNFTKLFTAPQTNGVNISVNHFWEYDIAGTLLTETGNSTVSNQSITGINLYNCSISEPTTSFYVRVLDADTETAVLGTNLVSQFTYWINSAYKLNKSFNSNAAANNYAFCVNPNLNYTFDGTFVTSATGYASVNTYLLSENLGSNNTEIIYLSNITGTSNIIYHVNDINTNPVQGAQVKAFKLSTITGLYNLVSTATTNSDGEALGQLFLNSDTYYFEIWLDGVKIHETLPTQILRTDIYFVVNLLENFLQTITDIGNIAHGLTYTNATRTWLFTYNDPSLTATGGCMEVKHRTSSADTTLYYNCSTGAVNTFSYNMSSASGLYIANGWITTASSPKKVLDTLVKDFNNNVSTFGTFGVLMAFLYIGTLAMVGMHNPVIAIVLTLIGLVGSIALGFVTLSYASVIILVMMGLFLIMRMKN